MRTEPWPPPPGWEMIVREVIPGLWIGTKLVPPAEYASLGVDAMVHCTEGLNRSGLVVAKTLMDMGRTANEAIKLVRDRRGPTDDGFEALCNEHFVEWLLRQRPDRSLPSLP